MVMHSFTRASRDISRYVLRKSFVKRQRGCREFPCRTLTRFARVSRKLFINFAGSTGFSGLDEPPSILPFCATVIPESARREGLPLGWNMPRNAIRNKGPPTNRRGNKSRGSDSPIRIVPRFHVGEINAPRRAGCAICCLRVIPRRARSVR